MNKMDNQFLYRFLPPPGKTEEYWELLRLLLQEDKVRLSRPSCLNDPFDCKSLFSVKNATFNDLQEFSESTVGRYGSHASRVLAVAAMKIAKSDPDRAIERLRRIYMDNHLASLDKDGILCFFQPPDDKYPEDILMWSHYANGHRGFCFQFRKCLLREKFICKQVRYVDTYPTLKEVAAQEGEGLADLFLFRKASRWLYENEWRLLESLENTDEGFLQLPSEALSGVIFGCESDPKDRECIIQWSQQRKGAPLNYFLVRKHSEEYRITIEKLDEQHIVKPD